MVIVILALSFLAWLSIVSLALVAWRTGRFSFWPPPSRDSWQYLTFWSLFRLFVAGLVVLSFLDYGGAGVLGRGVRLGIALPVAVVTFLLVILANRSLGWRNAHGETAGLRTEGVYRWSRNPVYVISIIWLVASAVVVNSWPVYGLVGLWCLFYVLAPFLEEPWLEREYGEVYRTYRREVPRFVRLRR